VSLPRRYHSYVDWDSYGKTGPATRLSVVAQSMLQSYALECKTSSVATNWSALSTNTGNGALEQLSDPAATAPQRFYRMRQW
jgi:hypothetical protein